MKKLFYIWVGITLLAIIYLLIPSRHNKNTLRHTDTDINTTDVCNDTRRSNEAMYSRNDRERYRGELILKYGNISVYLDEFCTNYDEISSRTGYNLIRYVDNIPTDTMKLIGPFTSLCADGTHCKIAIGVDTTQIDVTKPLHNQLNLRFRGVISNCKFYRLSRCFSLKEGARPTDFQVNIAIYDSISPYVCDFISRAIRDDVVGYFTGYDDDFDASIPEIPVYEMNAGNVQAMIRYYYRQFRKLYARACDPGTCFDTDAPEYGLWYSYQKYIYPVWQSQDSAYSTWKFYEYSYGGGAHGCESEYYLTFDNETGRILGADDFFSAKDFKKAITRLADQLYDYHYQASNGYLTEPWDADLGDGDWDSPFINNILTEKIDGKRYPRPAVTKQGIVFSYQTDFIYTHHTLHFTQPCHKTISEN